MDLSCPGLYCGRIELSYDNYSDCGSCPRGFRANVDDICLECDARPELYDWMYITFMAMLLVFIQWYIADQCIKRRQLTLDVMTMHLLSIVECLVSLLMTILLTQPLGSLDIISCPVSRISDWYTLFYNPAPDFRNTIRCTQEAVYPLYTLIFIFYSFSLILILIRPLFIKSLSYLSKMTPKMTLFKELSSDSNVSKVVYLTLYAIPALALVHALFCGIIYYSYPYLIIIGSIISLALHMAFQLDQRPSKLMMSVLEKRNVVIIICHWMIHSYGILALTQFKRPILHSSLLLLIPLPTLFYILTANFTDPNRLLE